ncbi:ferredoxin--NADP reductase [Halomarina litorea]|uniref:ferredoxin--NADP reductase n=1 Tax=Halomarina litorea TaxID=2961595 RepID=UPI0020C1E748|nr:FAD-binding oxidoreductase [Halomarina sp. BCD28]
MTHTAEVVSVVQLTPTVKQFRLRVPGHEFDFDPGQHTTVQFDFEGQGPEDTARGNDDADPTGEHVVRPYTATNTPGTDQITLAIKAYDEGLASAYMHQRRPGDEVELGEFAGNLAVESFEEDVAFVSTGTGITPMLAMLKAYLERGEGHVHFLYGEKSEEHVIYRETLEQLASEHENLDLTVVLSESDHTWNGPTGHVQEHLSALFETFDDRDFYVCGVPEMVVETAKELSDLGAPDDRVHTEGWEDGAVEGE